MPSLDRLNALRDLRADLEATRGRALDLRLPPADRRVAQQRLVAITAELERLEAPAAAPPPPPTPILDPKATPAQAAARARLLRADRRLWDPHRPDPATGAYLTAEEHRRMRQELRECDERATTPAPDSGAA